MRSIFGSSDTVRAGAVYLFIPIVGSHRSLIPIRSKSTGSVKIVISGSSISTVACPIQVMVVFSDIEIKENKVNVQKVLYAWILHGHREFHMVLLSVNNMLIH